MSMVYTPSIHEVIYIEKANSYQNHQPMVYVKPMTHDGGMEKINKKYPEILRTMKKNIIA
jgi:hypothetical protein